jgi:hypothetical protein
MEFLTQKSIIKEISVLEENFFYKKTNNFKNIVPVLNLRYCVSTAAFVQTYWTE